MPKYYNKSKGPLAVTLRSGNSATLTGKKWTEIPSEEEGSEDLMRLLRQGALVRFEEPIPQAPPPEVIAPVVARTKAVPAPAAEKSVSEKTSDSPRRRKA